MLLTPWLSEVSPHAFAFTAFQPYKRHNHRHRRRQRRDNVLAWVERLEKRTLLTTISLAGNDLLINTSGNGSDVDQLEIREDFTNSKFIITDLGQTLNTSGLAAFGSGTNLVEIPFSSVANAKTLVVDTFGGNDHITLSAIGGAFSLSPMIHSGDEFEFDIDEINAPTAIFVATDNLDLLMSAENIRLGGNLTTHGGKITLDGNVTVMNDLNLTTVGTTSTGDVQINGQLDSGAGQSVYTLITTPRSYAEAQAQATIDAPGGHLATIRSQSEQALVRIAAANNDVWIGASDKDVEGQWIRDEADADVQFWAGDGTTGSSVGGEYSNWFAGQPNDFDATGTADADAAILSGSDTLGGAGDFGRWSDGDINTARPYVVESPSLFSLSINVGTDSAIVTLNDSVGNKLPLQFLSVTAGETQLSGGMISAAQSLTFNSALTLSGPALLRAGEVDFIGGTGSVTGPSSLTLAPIKRDAAINVGATADAGTALFDITGTDIAALAAGFLTILIGEPGAGVDFGGGSETGPGLGVPVQSTGSVTITSSMFLSPVSISGGSISVTGLNARTNAVELRAAGGSITDGGDAGTDIVAGSLSLDSSTGIGLLSDTFGALETSVTAVSARATTSGGVFLDNTGILTIGATSAPGGIFTDNGTISVSSTGSLTVNQAIVTRGGDVSLTAADGIAINGVPVDTTPPPDGSAGKFTADADSNDDGTGTFSITSFVEFVDWTSSTEGTFADRTPVSVSTISPASAIAQFNGGDTRFNDSNIYSPPQISGDSVKTRFAQQGDAVTFAFEKAQFGLFLHFDGIQYQDIVSFPGTTSPIDLYSLFPTPSNATVTKASGDPEWDISGNVIQQLSGNEAANLGGTVRFEGGVSSLTLIRTAAGVSTSPGGDNTVNVQLGLFRAGGVKTADKTISIRAADVNLDGFLDANMAAVNLIPSQTNRSINLGTETAESLSLTDAELDRIRGGSIQIGDASSGSITISAPIDAMGTSLLSLQTGGAIVDGNTSGNDITETNLVLLSATGIGQGNALETSVVNLEATNSGAGGVAFSNIGGLTIGGISDAMTGVSTAGGGIDIATIGSLSIDNAIVETAGGSITLTASGATTSDTLTLNANITVSGGNGAITLNSDDGIMLVGPDADVNTTGSYTANADQDSSDSGAYSQDDPDSAVTASAASLTATDITLAGTIGIVGAGDGMEIHSSDGSQRMSLGGDDNAVSGINLTDAELAQISTLASGSITFGDANQSGDILIKTATLTTTAGAAAFIVQAGGSGGSIVLDDDLGTGTAMNGNGGSISLTADTGGIKANNSSNGAAEIATTGTTVTLLTTGAIGSSTNRIQFADNTNTAQQRIVIGSNSTQASSVFLDGLGSLTLAGVSGSSAIPTSIDVTARTNLVVPTGATISSGSASLSLSADLNADGTTGDDGTGTLRIDADAKLNTAFTFLRGADMEIAGFVGAAVNGSSTQQTNGVVIRSSLSSRPMSLGGANNAVTGINLTDAELAQIVTRVGGTIQIGDSSQTGDLTFVTARLATTSGAHTVVEQSTSDSGKIVLDDGPGIGTALNGNGDTVSLTAGIGGIQAASAPNAAAEIGNATTVSFTSDGGIGTSQPLQLSATSLSSPNNSDQFLTVTGSLTIDTAGLSAGSGTFNLTGGTLTLGGSDRINDLTDLNLAFGATFVMGTFLETIDQLILNDGSVTGSGTLTGGSTFDLRKGSISANLAGTGIDLTKIASDTVTLSGGVNTYSGVTTVTEGTLALVTTTTNNNIASSPTLIVSTGATLDVTGLDTTATPDTLILASGQTLSGTGTVVGKLIAADGSTISPGNSPGILNTGDVTFNSGSTFAVQIFGTTPGIDYDQLNVSGTVSLGNGVATLLLNNSDIPLDPTSSYIIINNDGTDSTTGFFSGFPEGAAALTSNGVTLFISYNGGDGNDVVLSPTPIIHGTSGSDTFVLRQIEGVVGEFEISTNSSPFAPLGPITTVTINGQDGNDELILDFANGNAIPGSGGVAEGVFFNGNNPTTGLGDQLTILGGDQGSVTYNAVNAHNGNIVMSNFGTVTYTGLEPITNTGIATDIVFNLPDTANDAVLEAISTAGSTFTQLRSINGTFETTTFSSPTGSLTINGGTEADKIFIVSIDSSFNATLTVNGGNGDDTLDATGFKRAVVLNGGSGNDTIIGGNGNDSIIGGDGFDAILGDGGDDSLLGGDGNDMIDGQTGNDSIDGEAGADSISDNDGNPSIVTPQQGANLFLEFSQQILEQKTLHGFDSPEVLALLQQFAEQAAKALGIPNALAILLDPIDFLVTDPQGRQAGYTAATGLVNEIPGSYYSGNGAVELLLIPQPVEGTYSLLLAGLGGPFNVATNVTNSNESQTTTTSSSLDAGSNLQVSINVGPSTIPVGLGLGGQGSGGLATFGVVGANDRLARNNAAARASEELESSLELTLDESNASPIDQLVNWIMTARATRERLVQQLFESLDLPFGNLLDSDTESGSKLTEALVDLFWKRLGQSLTGVPAGAYKLGDMLESLLPQNSLRSPHKTPAEKGKSDSGTNGKTTPKSKRPTDTRPRTAPGTIKKTQSDPKQLRFLNRSRDTSTAQRSDPNNLVNTQNVSALEAMWRWLATDGRRS